MSKRTIFGRLSIAAGNLFQLAGLIAAALILEAARSAQAKTAAVLELLGAWMLLYFCCHAIAHWIVGRMVGVRFAFYTIGGTGNPEGWPRGLRWVFEHLPFLGVQTEKTSMQNARPVAKAMMWSAGVTSSAAVPTLGVFWAWRRGIPYSRLFLIFALAWSVGTLASNWRSRTGDFAKARRSLGRS